MKKKLLSCLVCVGIMLTFIVGVSAATLSKYININCAYGTASETVTANITLATVNSPKFSYSNMQGTGKMIGSMYYSWSGFSNGYKKFEGTDSVSYKVTGTSKWRDSNYKEYEVSNYVYFYYQGSLS